MSAQHDGGIDWTPILAGIAGVLTAAGGAWVAITGVFRQRRVDKASDTEKTLDNVWKIVTDLKEERAHCEERIDRLEAELKEERAHRLVLETRIAELERQIAAGK